MAWHDVHACVRGEPVQDFVHHFCQVRGSQTTTAHPIACLPFAV